MPIDRIIDAAHNRRMQQGHISRFTSCLCYLTIFLGGFPAWAQDGEGLAKSWCSSCHAYPEPQLLDKETWETRVLPDMGARLGIGEYQGRIYHANPNAPVGVYASEPLMELSEWGQISAWYESNAPDLLELPAYRPRTPLQLFEIEQPRPEEGDFPTGTAVFIDEQASRLLVGDSYELDIEFYRKNLELLEVVRSGGATSRIIRMPSGGYLATIMGGTIGQSELLLGLLIGIVNADGSQVQPVVDRLVPRLHRPVDVVTGDFNDDGEYDYVIAEFGTYSGKLSLHMMQTDGTLSETVLLNDAGASSIAVVGNDLFVLVAQGDERIVRLRNFVDGASVVAETLLKFPPSQGSSSMKVLDFNGDGRSDALYTAGDNADISPIFKPYHGVYLFQGQPDGSLRQSMFFHLDGATNAVAEDFDQDGDLDIAAVAYYANLDRGLDQAGFVYLENNGEGFDAKYIEGLGGLGRFIAISVGDIDGDGDKDIALANLAFGPYGPMIVSTELQDQWLRGPRFVLLRNGLH